MSRKAPALPPDVIDKLAQANSAPVLVAVSGGADSGALALMAHHARADRRIPAFHIAHLNHLIRGRASDADAEFVRDLAELLGAPCIIEDVDVPAVARERRLSLEHAARECRYAFLAEAAETVGARFVLLGHTADDQVETVLHNAMRGAGIHGLAGMPQERPITSGSTVRILRPLLSFGREELEAFLTDHGWRWRTDETNRDTAFTRNRIRHAIIPGLAASWPTLREDVLDLAREMRDLDALLETRADAWMSANAAGGLTAHEQRVPLAPFRLLEEPLLSAVIRGIIARTLGDLRRINAVHVEMVSELIGSGMTGASLDLPRGLVVGRTADALRFGLRESVEATAAIERTPARTPTEAIVVLSIPGEARWGPWRFRAEVLDADKVAKELAGQGGESSGPERMSAFMRYLRETDPEDAEYLDFDRVGASTLTIRSRRPGDRFRPLGSPGSRKLKDFLISRKVPRTDREFIPLILADDRIIAVVGLAVSDTVRLSETTKRVLKIATH